MAATPPEDTAPAKAPDDDELEDAPADEPAKAKAGGRDAAIAAARDRELERQAAVVKAVDKAGRNDLPKIGGPLREPGLGR